MSIVHGGCGSHTAAPGQPQAGPSSAAGVSVHRCPFDGCGKTYAKASKLAQHVRSHTGERPFVCDHQGCGASYMRNEHLKAHQRRHQDPSEKPFACQEEGCGLRFWTSSQLKNHVRACHADHLSTTTAASASEHPCTELGCDMAFHKRKQLRQHVRDCHAEHPSIDGVGADTNAPIADDGPSAADLPFVCPHPDCGKRFATNSKRKTHARTHQGARYTCSMLHTHPQDAQSQDSTSLVYTFPTWSALQAHMREAHPPACPWPGCGKLFQRQDNLRAHYRRHENRKLRLELEAKVLEGSHEAELNHLRAELSDDSGASSSDEEEEQEAHELRDTEPPIAANDRDQPPPLAHFTVSNVSANPSPGPSDEELINKAAQLRSTRPRRGGVFRDLSSPALSIITSASGGTASVRPGSIATSLTSARDPSAAAFACTWNGCSKVFTRKNTLSIHVRTAHLGERPFECPDCGRRFAHKHLVSRHRRVCSGTRSSPEQSLDTRSRLRFSTVEQEGAADGSSDESISDSDSDAESVSRSDSGEDGMGTIDGVSSTIKPRLLDLLTGRGYSSAAVSPGAGSSKRPLAGDGDEAATAATKRRRTTRGRVFACPWTKICHELDQQVLDPELRSEVASADSDSPSLGHADACGHRFKRLYDLRRHLRAQHGLDLSPDELSAIRDHTPWASVQ